jgi:hypothetical protein
MKERTLWIILILCAVTLVFAVWLIFGVTNGLIELGSYPNATYIYPPAALAPILIVTSICVALGALLKYMLSKKSND